MLPEDPDMLVSVLNMKLRDVYPSLEALADDLDVSAEELLSKLGTAGYGYDKEARAFRPRPYGETP